MLSQLRSGALEFMTLSGLILSTFTPISSIYGIGYAWPGYKQVWAAVDGDLGALIRASIDKSGLYAFEKIWDNGFRQISSSTHPIRTPEDLKGYKIRVPVSPLWTSMFEALRRRSRQYQLQRGLLGATDKDRRGAGKPAG